MSSGPSTNSNNDSSSTTGSFGIAVGLVAFGATAALTAFRIRQHQIQRQLQKKFRIVSLCPSTTLTLYDLGLAECVVGRTKYCREWPGRDIPTYGGTKNPKWEKIRDIARPTHILFNMEENDYTQLPQAQRICQTLTDTPVTIEGSRHMVTLLGQIFGVESRAAEIVNDMDEALEELQRVVATTKPKPSFTYLYFIWHTPAKRVAGQGTYIHAMLEAAGGVNLAVSTISKTERYPLLPPDYKKSADYCLLSTDPFHFQDKHKADYQSYGSSVLIIDGTMISWHGSRTVEGLRYLKDFLEQNMIHNSPS